MILVMKKLLLCFIALFILSGCAAPDSFTIAVTIESDDEVYEVLSQYAVGDLWLIGSSFEHEDCSALTDTVYFTFNDESFIEGKKEDFHFVLLLRNGDLVSETNDSGVFDPVYGETYFYTVTGDFEDGFVLTENEN